MVERHITQPALGSPGGFVEIICIMPQRCNGEVECVVGDENALGSARRARGPEDHGRATTGFRWVEGGRRINLGLVRGGNENGLPVVLAGWCALRGVGVVEDVDGVDRHG